MPSPVRPARTRGIEPDHGRIVSADPANSTPNVLDGEVKSIIKIGGKIYVGGSFTQVREAGSGKPTLTRNRLFAFDAATGAIDPSFTPSLNKGEASALLPAPDGQSIYVGGNFSEINGVRHFVLARINAQTGAPITAFNPQLDARVRDLRLAAAAVRRRHLRHRPAAPRAPPSPPSTRRPAPATTSRT